MFAGAIVLSDGSIALAATLVLPPALSLLSVRFALRHDENDNAAQWIRYLQLFRVVPLFTVAMWWSLCDTYPQSGLLCALLRFCPRSVCFLLAPAVSIALARVIGYSINRKILARRWTNADLLRLTVWSTVARTLPLLMLAVGIDTLPNQGAVGFFWLAGAAVVALIGTIRAVGRRI